MPTFMYLMPEVSSLELWSNWRAAAHHYVFELGGTDEGFKRMFLLRCPIGPTAQDLESFLDGQMEEILVYRRAKSAEVRNREAVTRSRTTAEKEKLEKQEYWRRTGRR